jgi:Holliday junction DNA helicase RuvA
MIGRLTGKIDCIQKNPIIIDVGGVGYRVWVTQSFIKHTRKGLKTTVYIHTHIREDVFDLYGFTDQEELLLFEYLLTVPGIGPKTALSILERGTNAVEKAVLKADMDFFTTIPRLGKKNAQKIIIELKNKLGGLKDLDLTGQTESETKQIFNALVSMGFQRNEIIEALKKIPQENLTIEQKIRQLLKLLGAN